MSELEPGSNSVEAFNKACTVFIQAFTDWSTVVFRELNLWLERAMPAIQAFYDTIHTAYLDAGAPYGDTQEGMLRWVQERGVGA